MLSSSSYIDERAGIAFVHRNPIQKLTALDAERISFLDAVQQSPDKIKRYEARARRRIRASLDPLLLAFILNKNKNKNQTRTKAGIQERSDSTASGDLSRCLSSNGQEKDNSGFIPKTFWQGL
ncbi:hypothetical protein [Caballeronia sp. 15711]|uniref:hypothetical protein n=1 Tax=Caballeronia sp. 15711 TaxID=3391029 RepID=UPI0039E70D76